jgi:predicted GH43/DUF377 family glycosyl hydrolase
MVATYRNGELIAVGGVPVKNGKPLPPFPPRLPPADPAKAAPKLEVLPCIHRGEYQGVTGECQSCAGKVTLKMLSCDTHGYCSPFKQGRIAAGGVTLVGAVCHGCKDRVWTPPVLKTICVPDDQLVPGEANAHFNASLIRWRGQLLLAYRTGWQGAKIHVARLTDDYSVIDNTTLELWHPRANYGREDPRFFVWQDKLHLSFIGVRGQNRRITTHQLYACLDDDLRVSKIIYPHYDKRMSWEKNHSYFGYGDRLFAVYTIKPHVVLELLEDQAREAYVQSWNPIWPGGHLRGGASPVLVGDEYICFFHGKREPEYLYSLGVLTFDARPPFRPRRMLSEPLLWANRETQPRDQYCPVIFPCGAILENDTWKISCGVHDRHTEIYEFSHRHIDRAMVRV